MTSDSATGSVPGTPAVVVLGRKQLTLDIVLTAVTRAGMAVIDLRDEGGTPADIALLVDPDPQDWEAAAAVADAIVLVSSVEVDGAAVPDAIRRGAAAVVDLRSGVDHVLETVRTVAAHGCALTPEQTRLVVRALRESTPHHFERPALSSREADVLESIARGYSLKQTARSLGISSKTVENAQSRLYLKLGVRTRAQAVARAYDRGLLTFDPPAS